MKMVLSIKLCLLPTSLVTCSYHPFPKFVEMEPGSELARKLSYYEQSWDQVWISTEDFPLLCASNKSKRSKWLEGDWNWASSRYGYDYFITAIVVYQTHSNIVHVDDHWWLTVCGILWYSVAACSFTMLCDFWQVWLTRQDCNDTVLHIACS